MTSADVALSRHFAFSRPSVMPFPPPPLKEAITLLVKKQQEMWSKLEACE